jgi:predicted  nucleic acid-binding Zn-ribbon protein
MNAMAPTKDDFAVLLKLQKADRDLDALRAKIAEVPEDVAAIRKEIEDENEKLKSSHEKSKEVQAKKKDRETTMAQKEEAIKKHQGELNQVKSNEAFKALLKEIDDEKNAVGELETEILELMDEVDAVRKEEAGIQGQIDGFVKEREGHIAELEAKKADLEKDLAEWEKGRLAIFESLPADLSDFYEKTRERRGGVAVSPLKEKSCSVCKMNQPPQAVVNVNKGSLIVTCDSCQRILVPAEKAVA